VVSGRKALTSAGGPDLIRTTGGYMPRDKVILACQECQERNYNTTKNKRLHPERVEYKKYCPRCRDHTPHKETK